MRIWYVRDMEHHCTRPTKKHTLGVLRSRVHEVIAGKRSPEGSLRTPSYKTATNLMATLDAVLDQFQAETLQEEARQK